MSARRIDFDNRDWAAHAQDHWLDFAGNPNFPDYLRTVFVAYGRHAANGHALLDRGELAHFLVRKDGTLPERRIVWRAVKEAVNLGYLATDSQALCLVVGSHDVQGGKGDPDARCRRDHTRKGKTNVRNDCGRFPTNVRNGARRSETNVRSEGGRSTLSPSSLLQQQASVPEGHSDQRHIKATSARAVASPPTDEQEISACPE